MSYRILITGGRTWSDQHAVWSALDLAIGARLLSDVVIVHGACYPPKRPDNSRPMISADWLAECWCKANGVTSDPRPADWDKYGKGAGPIRNLELAKGGGDLCLAFWSGEVKGSGTHGMVVLAVKYGIPVRIVPKAVRK